MLAIFYIFEESIAETLPFYQCKMPLLNEEPMVDVHICRCLGSIISKDGGSKKIFKQKKKKKKKSTNSNQRKKGDGWGSWNMQSAEPKAERCGEQMLSARTE